MSRVTCVTFLSTFFVIACAPSVPRSPDPHQGDTVQPLDAAFDRVSDGISTILEVDGGHTTARDGAVKDIASGDGAVRDAASEGATGDDGAAARADAARPKDAVTGADGKADAGESGRADSSADADAGVSDGDADGGGADRGDGIDGGDGAALDGSAVVGRPPGPGDLKIDELLINPAGTDTNREWIEIANRSGVALDLHDLHVADAASEVALDAGVLDPEAFLVLGQSLDPARNGGAPIAFSFGNTVSLNNGGDTIRLCLGACSDGVVLDQVDWSADPGAAFDGHAAVVVDGADGGVTFCPAAEPFGTAGSFGSPGQANPPCPD